MSNYYPILLDINRKLCKVIGGGKVAERKVNSLLKYGAIVEVISPFITYKLEKYVKKNMIKIKRRKYIYGDLEGSFLVYAATDDKKINELCLKECKEKKILLNVVDKPEMCNFIVPSNVQRGDLNISISTNGKSPMLSRKIREDLEKIYVEEYSEYVEILGEIRKFIKKEVKDINKRRNIFSKLVYSEVIDKYINGEILDLKKKLYSLALDATEYSK